MRHHYVPQCYLRQFCVPNKEGYLYAYQRQEEPFETKTKSVAAKNDLYAFTDKTTGKKNYELEETFSYLEGIVAPILERLSQETAPVLSNKNHNALAEFIGYLHVRNLAHRAMQENVHATVLKTDFKLMARDKEAFKRTIIESKADVDVNDEQKVEDLRQRILNFDEHFGLRYSGERNDEAFLRLSLETALEINPIIFNKEWTIFECDSNAFVTSDNPVAIVRPIGMPGFYGVGIANGNIALPVSPRRCLFLTNGDSSMPPHIEKVSAKEVDFINRHTMFYAHQFLYAHGLLPDVKAQFDKTKSGESEKVIVFQ